RDETITLIRDRFGEKPLYYGFQKGTFMFASELKALKPHPDFEGIVDREALGYFMKYSYVPTPKSIYSGIKKLSPGCFVSIKYENNNWHLGKVIKYWNLLEKKLPSQKIHYSEALEKIEFLLTDTIKMQRSADVSVGSFLSGGIDSSLVTTLMQANSTRKINTYTIGFSEKDYDESKYAAKIAKHIGTDHNEYIASHQDIMNVIPSLPLLYDEPFADSSQIPTYLVCNFASKDITVALSGDGGDEIFSGYNRYIWAPKIMSLINKYPHFFRKIFKNSTKNLKINHIQNLYNAIKIILPKSYQVVSPVDKFEKILRIIDKEDEYEVYDMLTSIMHKNNPTLNFEDNFYSKKKEIFSNSGSNYLEKMMHTDIANYMLDDILVKVDRAAMANSLETRMPFLDHRIFEYTKTIPINYLSNKSKSKILLRDILKKYIPETILERPKAGFGMPIDTWLRKPLKNWVYDTLDLSIIHNQSYLNTAFISDLLDDHMSGKANRHHEIWNILVWQNWIMNE
ncbi:asparagine synthase (glutamine-hydrolyzing), partial [Pelagibacteraceae bacterium]|nr:asparagine synthase (glutamine-hydrolyzing) [Pelagibacteraceae bacterium]